MAQSCFHSTSATYTAIWEAHSLSKPAAITIVDYKGRGLPRDGQYNLCTASEEERR